MVFNGLSGSDLVVFNALHESDLSKPLPISEIERLTNYHYHTIQRALKRLVDDYQIVVRHEGRGKPYSYSIRDNSYVVFNS